MLQTYVQVKRGVLGVPLFPTETRWGVIRLALERAPREGLCLEFGVYKGESINFIAGQQERPIFGFDSFEGLPEKWTHRIRAGHFSIQGHLPTVAPGVELIQGWFDQTIPRFLEAHPKESVAFLHVDCDLYRSAQTILKLLDERLVPGTVIVFDEYCQAVPDDEWRAWSEFCRPRGVRFEYLESSITGSVALRVTSRLPTPT